MVGGNKELRATVPGLDGVGNADAMDVSPIEEVRLTVSNSDDPTLPVWTFRMWALGVTSCALLAFLNQFFAYRTEPLVITQITVQVAVLPIGRFLAAVLPTAAVRLPGLGRFSLNPGPFNMKEHVLITIFANAGSAFGSGSAYAVGIVTIIKAFYHRNISILAAWILIITTQVRASSPYILSAGLDAGVAFMAVLPYLSVGMENVSLTWWSAEGEHCDLASCPTATGIEADGCPVS